MLVAVALAIALIALSPIGLPLMLIDALTGGPGRRRTARHRRRVMAMRREHYQRRGLTPAQVEAAEAEIDAP